MCRNPVALWKLKEVCDVSVIRHICKIFNMFVHSHAYIFIFQNYVSQPSRCQRIYVVWMQPLIDSKNSFFRAASFSVQGEKENQGVPL